MYFFLLICGGVVNTNGSNVLLTTYTNTILDFVSVFDPQFLRADHEFVNSVLGKCEDIVLAAGSCPLCIKNTS